MKEERVYVESGKYWVTDGYLDPITEEGLELLFIDGTRERYPYVEKVVEGKTIYDVDIPFNFRRATDEEYKKFYMERGWLFLRQEVEVIKGKTLEIGSKHIIKKFYTYIVPGTKNKVGVDYVVFEDGSKINIENIKPTCELKEGVKQFFEFKHGYNVGGSRRIR